MKRLYATVGLPRSGKSTWAKQKAKECGCPIVNPDSIRLAIHGKRFLPSKEGLVWMTAKTMVKALFLAGHEEVILDATNVNDDQRKTWISDDWETMWVWVNTPKIVCLTRADAELKPVIEKMAAEYKPPTGWCINVDVD